MLKSDLISIDCNGDTAEVKLPELFTLRWAVGWFECWVGVL